MRATTPIPEDDVLARRDPHAPDNDWPEFELHNARAYRASDNAPISLLQASEHHPVTVVGVLQPLPKALARLSRGKRVSPTIEVADVRLFAYGQYKDGDVGIWAAGKAGWYILQPAASYRKTFESMKEAVNVWYFVVDAYRPRKSARGKALPAYTAPELFERYAKEKLGQTRSKGAEAIYEHRDFLFQAMLAKDGAEWASNPLYLHLLETFPDDHAAVKRRLASPKVAARMAARRSSAEASTRSNKAKRSKVADSESTTSKDDSKVAQRKPKLEPPSRSKSRTADSTQRKTKSASTRQGRTTRSTQELSSESDGPETQATPVNSDSSDEDGGGPRRGKSGLRLRPSMAGKFSARSGKLLPAGVDEHGEISTPSYSTTAGKRKLEDEHTRRRKRRRGAADVDEGIDMPSSPSASEADEDATSNLAVRLRHEPDPVQEDTWICALDGCVHKVYNASDPESQHLIREHYALHAYDDDERVRFVKELKQPSLPVSHLLERVKRAAKVEGFPGSKVAGTRFPEPIAQRY